MKKLLALVLALVMTLGLATVGTNAAYKDADSINYKEAVDVMSAIGVLAGDETGFRPADTLKRSEGAKIVTYLMVGNKTAEALQGSGTKFTDLPANHWAAGYMEYLASVGVMGGVGDGKIDPDGQLTATAFGKMLLVALGYDASIEGFGGTDWAINVQKVANQVGIYGGNDDVVGSAAVTREEAALYAFNTVCSPLVEYESKGATIAVNGATVDFGASKASYVTNTIASVQTISDTKLSNSNAYLVEFAEQYYPKLVRKDTVDYFGRDAVEWDYQGKKIDTYVDKSDLIATYTASAKKGDLYNLIGSTDYGKLGGSIAWYVWQNGENVESPRADFFLKDSSAAAGISGNGVLTEVYRTVDDDGDVSYKICLINVYVVQATADYNSSTESLPIAVVEFSDTLPAIPNQISQDDFDVSGYKEDDYLIVTYSERTDSIASVAKAQLLEGKVSQYTEKSNVTIDGTKYSYNKLCKDDGEKDTAYTINENAIVVLDPFGYIIHVDTAVATNSYVFVRKDAEEDALKTKVIADAYFADGKNETITVGKYNGETVTAAGGTYKGNWTTYTVVDGKYSLAKIPTNVEKSNTANGSDAAVTFVNNNKVAFVEGAKGNANTIFVLRENDGTVNAYTGITNVPAIKIPAGGDADIVKVTYINNASDFAKLVFIDVLDKDVIVEGVDNAANYLFLLKSTKNKTVLEGTEYYEYKAIIDGEVVTRFVADTLDDQDQGQLYRNIKVNSKDYVTSGTVFDAATTRVKETLVGAEAAVSGSSLSIGDNNFIVDSNTDINLIIGDNSPVLKDENADYETALHISAASLVSRLRGWTFDGTVYATVASGSEKASQIFVFVTDADNGAVAGNTITFTKGTGVDSITVTASKAGTVTTDSTKVTEGETVTVVVTPSNKDYNVSLTSAQVTPAKSDTNATTGAVTYTFAMPAGAVTLTNKATGNVVLYAYDYGTTSPSTVEVGEISNVRFNSDGDILATMTINALDWAYTGTAKLVGTVYIDGADYTVNGVFGATDTANITGTTGTARKSVTLSSNGTLAAGIVDDISLVEFGDDIAVQIQKVRIRYLDGDNSNEVLTPNDDTGKIKATTTVKDALTTTGQATDVLFNTNFTDGPDDVTPNELQYTVSGITAPVTTKTTFTNSNNLSTTAGRLAVNPIALGTGFVDVTVYGLNDLAALEPYAITSVFDGGVKIGAADTTYASHALKNVTITPTYTVAGKTGTAGQSIGVTYAITAPTAGDAIDLSTGNVGYKMTLSDGTVFYFDNGAALADLAANNATANGVNVVYGDTTAKHTVSTFVDSDIEIKITSIETINTLPTISSVEYADVNADQKVGFATSGDTITLTFSTELSAVPTVTITGTNANNVSAAAAFKQVAGQDVKNVVIVTLGTANFTTGDAGVLNIGITGAAQKIADDVTGMVNRFGYKITLPIEAPAANGLTAVQQAS